MYRSIVRSRGTSALHPSARRALISLTVCRVSRTLHVGVTHARRRHAITPPQIQRQHLDGVLGYSIRRVRIRGGFIDRQRFEVRIAVGAVHLPIAALELSQRTRAGKYHTMLGAA